MNTAEIYQFPGPEQGQFRSNRMENQRYGYIPLYRSIRKKSWAKDVFLRTLWENLLMDAARKPYTANFKGHVWQLQPGQLVTTSDDLGLLLCDRSAKPTSRHAVERMLSFFQKEEMISVSTVHRKGTLITILNYSEYAEKIDNLPAHNDAHNGEHNKPSDGAALSGTPAHNDAHYPAHHEQEGNNNTKRSSSENSHESSDARLMKFLSAHPEAFVYTPTGAKWGTADDNKAARWMHKQIQIVIPSSKIPSWPDWANSIRLMRQQDNLSHKEICEVFQWANRDKFWCSNILSPAKLREKWQTLCVQKGQPNRKTRDDIEQDVPHWNSAESWSDFI